MDILKSAGNILNGVRGWAPALAGLVGYNKGGWGTGAMWAGIAYLANMFLDNIMGDGSKTKAAETAPAADADLMSDMRKFKAQQKEQAHISSVDKSQIRAATNGQSFNAAPAAGTPNTSDNSIAPTHEANGANIRLAH